MIDERLAELGIELPNVFPPAANYVGCVVDGDHLYVSGHGPINGSQVIVGKLGADLTVEQGAAAARLTGLSILATMRNELGSLDRIDRIVKLLGMVNVAPGFTAMPAVIDGCSDLFVEVFGE